MENKTPEQWFQLLKEPYRSEAIAGINRNVLGFKEYPKSLTDALFYCIYWGTTKDKKPTREDWWIIQHSIKAGETTYLETELKPQDMISGEWYVVDCGKCYRWLIKFREFKGNKIYNHIAFNLDDHCYCDNARMYIGYNKSNKIRPATREEVLKYFPNEFQEEKKEVNLTDLETGNYYTLSRQEKGVVYKYTFKFKYFTKDKKNPIGYEKAYIHHTKKILKDSELSNSNCLIYHATQEEINMLEEKKEAKSELENGEWYYYSDKDGFFRRSNDLEFVLKESINNGTIYKAIPIGTKQTKSILEPINK